MSDLEKTPTREERLAAKLRENLHRRKAQARAVSHVHEHETGAEARTLPKTSTES